MDISLQVIRKRIPLLVHQVITDTNIRELSDRHYLKLKQ